MEPPFLVRSINLEAAARQWAARHGFDYDEWPDYQEDWCNEVKQVISAALSDTLPVKVERAPGTRYAPESPPVQRYITDWLPIEEDTNKSGTVG